MLRQNIKALLLFISTMLTIVAISDYFGAGKDYPGLIGAAFVILLLSNIVDLIDNWHGERRKIDLVGEDKLPWMLRRQAD